MQEDERIRGLSLYQIASEMVEMRVFNLEDIKTYGYTESEARAIKENMKKM